ncbi:hypothetical protein [Pseudophaeobacter leonis]|uniref:hypothetical protein n=1 Tax=Pseudophaeobacter leonis TaxID=1144477 RepID=UPI001F4E0C98|nr:hypothetical protein [Pseudophaeobacter leonis]
MPRALSALIALAFSVLLLPGVVLASPVKSVLPDAQVRGAATFRFVGFPIYEAQLFTRAGAPLDWEVDFGLGLTYLRSPHRARPS